MTSKRGTPASTGDAPPPARSLRRATSYDVARLAEVSQSAVSRCFAPGGSIAPATRERIMKVARDLGYRPNALAQGLISGRTKMVAVLITTLTNRFYPEVLAELCTQLTAHDTRILLFALNAESDVDAVLDQVWRHNVDGVISAARLSDAQVRLFADHGVPLVLYNRQADAEQVASVCCDSAAGERDLIGRLLGAGHRRFGLIAGPPDSYVGEERRSAALQRLEEAGITGVPVVRGDFGYVSGRDGLRALMAEAEAYEAIVAVSDQMAIGAIDMARDSYGLSVPDQLSVVGFDGTDPATWSSYSVTSIRQPVRRMTMAAVTMLLERVADPALPAERRLFAGEFIPGASARIG